MSFLTGTRLASFTLWTSVQADLPRWICGTINRMGLPKEARGIPGGEAPSCPSGRATRAALLRDEGLLRAITNEVFLELDRCTMRGACLDDQEKARGLAYVVTVRTAQRMATTQARHTAACSDMAESEVGASPTTEDPEQVVAARQVLRRVDECLAVMSEVDRDILRSITDGESFDEIAARTGLKQVTVRSRLFRIRARLRETLSLDAERSEAA